MKPNEIESYAIQIIFHGEYKGTIIKKDDKFITDLYGEEFFSLNVAYEIASYLPEYYYIIAVDCFNFKKDIILIGQNCQIQNKKK
jgi:hypothetical protein